MPVQKEDKHPQQTWEDPPPDSDTRVYTDFILYFVAKGKFKDFPLLSSGRRQGILDLLGQRVVKLTQDRRLRPVEITLTLGEKPQRVYLICSVRKEVSDIELRALVDEMNNQLKNIPQKEREAFVRDLIKKTSGTKRPGINYLPGTSSSGSDASNGGNVSRDAAGFRNLPSEEETYAAEVSNRERKRGSDDITLPSTSSKLPEAKTDSEASSPPPKKKHKSAGKSTTSTILEGDEQAVNPENNETEPMADEYAVAPAGEQGEQTEQPADVETLNQSHVSVASVESQAVTELSKEVKQLGENVQTLSRTVTDTRKDYVPMKDFQDFCTDVLGKLAELKATCEKAIEARRILEAMSGTEAAVTEPTEPSHESPPPAESPVNSVEYKLDAYLPINSYTPDVKWLLEQAIVQDHIKNKVMKELYSGFPKAKASPEDVVYAFVDAVFSERFQSHCGLPGSAKSNYQFGRMPFPDTVYDLFERKIMTLGRPQASGLRSHKDIFKDKFYTEHTQKVLTGKWVMAAQSVEETAIRLYWERLTFYENGHQWLFSEREKNQWTFEVELSKAKKFKRYKNGQLDSDPNFSFDEQTCPENIEDQFWPMMVKGRVPGNRQEVEDLVKELQDAGLSTPTFTRNVWAMIKSNPGPSTDQIEKGVRRVARQEKTRKRRNKARRRQASSSDEDDDGKSTRSGVSSRSGRSRASRRSRGRGRGRGRGKRAKETSSEDSSGEDSSDSDSESSTSSDDDGRDDEAGGPAAGTSRARSHKSGGSGKSARSKQSGKSGRQQQSSQKKSGGHKRQEAPESGTLPPESFGTFSNDPPRDNDPCGYDPTKSVEENMDALFGPMSTSSSSGNNPPGQQPNVARLLVTDDTGKAADREVVVTLPEGQTIENLTPEQISLLVAQSTPVEEPPAEAVTVEPGSGPVIVATGNPQGGGVDVAQIGKDILEKAIDFANIETGVSATATVHVGTDTTQNVDYSAEVVTADKANVSVRGTRVAHVAQDHTVTRPVPREKTPMQRYAEMEKDYLTEDLSSSTTPTTPSTESTSAGTKSSESDPVPRIISDMDRLTMPPPSRAPSVGTSVSPKTIRSTVPLPSSGSSSGGSTNSYDSSSGGRKGAHGKKEKRTSKPKKKKSQKKHRRSE